ncbi:hypothetical protein C2845_PM07G11780 [Panicum miliaceum]|uniref:Uncharacterized protein n=1 Tax=Panicum miliaceum TaxID=4540 RepID=A0A3L6SLS1_PANMI|nr:hypothetical protein C2845_PM07G11780 [Panicum miliaceum]
MPKVVYDKLNHHALAPTAMCLQLADQSVRYHAGVAENIPVKIRNFFIPVDFVVLDMEVDTKTPLILRRPFLSTANAHIDVGAGEFQLNINGQKEKFSFRPKVEQCSQVKIVNRKQQSEKKLDKEPKNKTKKKLENLAIPAIESLIELIESIRIREKEIKVHNQRNAKQRTQRKKFLESEKKEIKSATPMKKVWHEKVSPLTETPASDDNQTQGMESPAPNSKPELSP